MDVPRPRTARLEPVLLTVTAALLSAGGVAWLAGAGALADLLWGLCTVVAVAPAVGWVLAALRRGQAGVDLIAVLALGGTLAVGEYLAGALIALMLATGRALEAAARRRASRDLRALLERAPRTARLRVGGAVRSVPCAEVAVGDVVVVGPGEVVPVDGRVTDVEAVLDESALTGEPLAVRRAPGEAVRSGVVNAGAAFELRASATERDSTYAGIVRLAREAGAESAPVVRLADRYAAWFLPLSLASAGLAWLLSGDAVRAVAVLVVATPCPLLLAAPVAVVSGLSRASRLGVVVRDGGALETLGRARTLLLDKTGTLTGGRPRVLDVIAAPGTPPSEVLRLAASLDQYSPHVLARAVVDAAHERGLKLSPPTDVTEEPGRGAAGVVEGRRVTVGRLNADAVRPDRSRRSRTPTEGTGAPRAVPAEGRRTTVGHLDAVRPAPARGADVPEQPARSVAAPDVAEPPDRARGPDPTGQPGRSTAGPDTTTPPDRTPATHTTGPDAVVHPPDTTEQPGQNTTRPDTTTPPDRTRAVDDTTQQPDRHATAPDAAAPPDWIRAVDNRALLDGAAVVWLTVEGRGVGAVLLRDPVRADAARTVRRLRGAGMGRLVMLTGDRAEPAREVGAVLGLDGVQAGLSPAGKVAAVRAERERAVTVMVGDGVNDAPALAAADVGVAMGAHGSTASSEAAGVVLTTDRVDRLADAVGIAVRARRIAVQSALGGMAMSLAAMVAAAFGLLPPAAGALLQEGIDATVILNALRALGADRAARPALEPGAEALIRQFAAEHDDLRDVLDAVRCAADRLSAGIGPEEALATVTDVHRLLTERLLPHEHAEEHQLYPALAPTLGGPEATATMSRAHAEIDRLARRIATHVALAGPGGRLAPEQLDDLRACLYGLHTVLRLHFIQEEESYFSLAP